MVAIYKVDKLTMRPVKMYTSYKECAADNDQDVKTLTSMCREKRSTRGRYVYRWARDFDPNESFEGKIMRPLTVEDVESGRVWAVQDLDWLSDAINVSKKRIRKSMTDGSLVLGRLKVAYLR